MAVAASLGLHGRCDRGSTVSRLGATCWHMPEPDSEHSLAATTNVGPPVQRVWQLFVRERLRRETALSLQMFRSFTEVRVPYLDSTLVSLLLALPPELKLDDTLQSHMLRRHRPDFLRVVNANTGAPLGASPIKTRVASLRMKVLAKFGVPGYQPYETAWPLAGQGSQGSGAQSCVCPTGSSAAACSCPRRCDRIVSQHEARTHNHTFLIMAMLIFEIAQEELFEPRALGGDAV